MKPKGNIPEVCGILKSFTGAKIAIGATQLPVMKDVPE